MPSIPPIGGTVHYVSYGTPGGEYTSQCRAAIVTETDTSDTVGLAVLNPTGLFFDRTVVHDEGFKTSPHGDTVTNYKGGTWHWLHA
jgi:hypothetical protein